MMSFDPFPGYARMRERGPVHREGAYGPWIVCGHAEVESVLKDPRTFSSRMGGGGMGSIGRSMLFMDPPEHTHLRNIISRAFTPRSIAELEPRIRELTVDLLDRIEMSDPFDIVEALAVPLPVTVIAQMLGIDPADRADFKRWSNAVTGLTSMSEATLHAEFSTYIERVLDERRHQPRDDLISRLLTTSDAEPLSVDDLLAFIMLLLVAGNETTTNLIGLAAFYLSQDVGRREELVADPTLIPNAIEELIRFDGPVHMSPPRVVTGDVTVGDVDMRRGDWLMVMLAAANRDERRFADADVLDIHRKDAAKHVGFGSGVHFCLGAPLARLEGRIVLEEFLARAPRFRLADPTAPVRFADNSILRSITSLAIVA
jgi:cytochrome P450